jgi:hypothetical protein
MYPDEWAESLRSSDGSDVVQRIKDFFDAYPDARGSTTMFRSLVLLHDVLGLDPRQMNAVSGWLEGNMSDDELRRLLMQS